MPGEERTSGCAPSRGAWALIAILAGGAGALYWSASSSKELTPREYPERAAGALKAICTAQDLHREGHGRREAKSDYATLAELSAEQLVDGVLGSGTKLGYLFTCQPSPTTPEFLWMATASPVVPGETGDRYFMINQAGVVFQRKDRPFTFDPTCAAPADATPVGSRSR